MANVELLVFKAVCFALVYCTYGISEILGFDHQEATFDLFLARKLCVTICSAGVVKGFQPSLFKIKGGGVNTVSHGYTKGDDITGTLVLIYTVFSATGVKRNAQLLCPYFGSSPIWISSVL